MSAFDTKTLERAATGGRARRSLASLRCAHGYRALEGPPHQPTTCRICPMDTESRWRLVTGSGQGATYEIEQDGEGSQQ